jgi:hypothetical protein
MTLARQSTTASSVSLPSGSVQLGSTADLVMVLEIGFGQTTGS